MSDEGIVFLFMITAPLTIYIGWHALYGAVMGIYLAIRPALEFFKLVHPYKEYRS